MAVRGAEFFLCAGALAFGGCVATREDVAGLEVQVARLEKSLNTLEKRQAELSANLVEVRRPVENLNSNLSDTQNLLNNFNPRFEELRAILFNLRKDMAEKIAALDGEFDKKLSFLKEDLEKRASELKSKASNKLQDRGKKPRALDGNHSKAGKQNLSAEEALYAKASEVALDHDTKNPAELYREAYRDFQAKRWDLAEAAFSEYVRGYPDGIYADESLFYWAKAAQEKKNTLRAKELLTKLSQEYPRSALVKTAMVEKAKILLGESKISEAEGLLEFVSLNYPSTKESQEAKDLLASIGGR